MQVNLYTGSDSHFPDHLKMTGISIFGIFKYLGS